MMDYGDGGWWVVMWVSMAVFWGLLIIGVLTVVNWFGDGRKRGESPDDVLDRRFAAGEIDQTQYRVLREELHRHPEGPAAPAH